MHGQTTAPFTTPPFAKLFKGTMHRQFVPFFCLLFLAVVTTRVVQAQQESEELVFYPALLTTQQYDTSQSYRQDLCERHRLYASGKNSTLRDALSGLKLHPVITYGVDWYFEPRNRTDPVTGNGYYEGYNPENPGILVQVLDEVARRANFTWKESYAVTPGPTGDTDWTTMIEWMVNYYDIAIGPMTKLRSRVDKGIDFPTGFMDLSLIMIGKYQVEEERFSAFSILKPFTFMVWMAILLNILLSGIVIWILENGLGDPSERWHRPRARNIYRAAISVTGNFEESNIKSNAIMLFQFSLSFWSTLILAAYTANLASFMVVKNTPPVQFETLEEAMAKNLKVCLPGGTAVDLDLTARYPNAKNLVRKEQPWPDIFDGVNNNECVVAVTTVTAWKTRGMSSATNKDCKQLKQVGRVYETYHGGFATKYDHGDLCSSLIADVLSLHFNDMYEDGTTEELLGKYMYLQEGNEVDCEAKLQEDANRSDQDETQLTLVNMGGTFVFHGILTVASLVTFVLRKRKFRNQQKQRTYSNSSSPVVSSRPQKSCTPTTAAAADGHCLCNHQMKTIEEDLKEMRAMLIEIVNEEKYGQTKRPSI